MAGHHQVHKRENCRGQRGGHHSGGHQRGGQTEYERREESQDQSGENKGGAQERRHLAEKKENGHHRTLSLEMWSNGALQGLTNTNQLLTSLHVNKSTKLV